ncbi:MAG: ABC transporter permease [Planctomycetota bacterium]|jgi:putative ABC transport system permease protein
MAGFRIARTIKLGLKSLALHKMRSGLTVLGIIFGVCSVIAMLSIGEGASFEAQEQIRMLGSNNIIIRSVKPPEDQRLTSERSYVLEYGLTYDDAERIRKTIPSVVVEAPCREIREDVYYKQRRGNALVVGTVPWYSEITRFHVERGRFVTDLDIKNSKNICVLGKGIARELFLYEEPLGKEVKIQTQYYRVVGIMEDKATKPSKEGQEVLEYNRLIIVPLSAAKNRFGEILVKAMSGSRELERVELHQLTLKVLDQEFVEETAISVETVLDRFHKKKDYELIVPLELLRRARETKRIFNIVLGSIAAISLLVGGIGIMNIMLASITERTREIGIRRALGAKKKDIITQFLVETVVLSTSGGLLGVIFGVIIPLMVTYFSEMRTVITAWSLILAFGISAAVGIIFGLYPAIRAADMDPIEALRHE